MSTITSLEENQTSNSRMAHAKQSCTHYKTRCLLLLQPKQTKQRYEEEAPCMQKRLITIEHVWFPVAQTLIGKAGRQRGAIQVQNSS